MPETRVADSLETRAQRVPVRTSVWFRANRRPVWSPGETVNISRSGILLRALKEIEPGTLLEMHIVFPADMTGGAPVDLVCWGPVVRQEASGLAATILNYRFKKE